MTAATADIGILTADTDLTVQAWNGWLEAATGITADRARGKRLDLLVPDLAARGLLRLLQETTTAGTVQVLAPAFHHFFVKCAPRSPSAHFATMQQRTTIGPLLDGTRIAGVILWIEDVTPQLDAERDLAAALASDDEEQRRAAAESIAAAGRVHSLDSFAPALGNPDWRVRAAAVHGLSRVADSDLLLSVVATLGRDHRNFDVLSSALKLLAMSDANLTAPLVDLLHHQDADLRIQAALALGGQHDPSAVEALTGALADSDVNVRFHAIEALGRLRATTAVDALVAVVESLDFFLAFPALDALALIRDARVAPALVPLLENPLLRDPVARVLGAIGSEDAVAPLAAALDSGPDGTTAAAQALASIEQRYEQEMGDGRRIADLGRRAITARGRALLLAALPGASPEEAAALATVVSWLRGDDVANTLADLFSDPAKRPIAADALVRYGDDAVDVLVAQLTDDDRDTGRAAIDTLGRLGSRRAVPALLALLEPVGRGPRRAGDPLVQNDTIVAVNGALARIGDPAACEPLIGLIRHRDAAVRQSAIAALNAVGDPDLAARLAALLSDADPLARESAVRIAGHFGYPATADAVFGRLADEIEAVRIAALEQLPSYRDDPRMPLALLSALSAGTPRVRAAAARSLGRVTQPGAAQALVHALDDGDAWVRYYAARALGNWRYEAAVPRLAEMAGADAAPHVRIAALDALAVQGGAAPIATLVLASADSDGDVAGAAIRALGRSRAAGALPALHEAARQDDPHLRAGAMRALGEHASQKAVDILRWAAGTESSSLARAAAFDGLGAIAGGDGPAAAGAIDALLALCADPDGRDAAVPVMSRLRPERIADVARGLRDPQENVRRATVASLVRFRHPAASPFLAGALDDRAAPVREDAIRAIGRLGLEEMKEQLERLARHDPSPAVRRTATGVLANYRALD